ncbi:MAG: trypsin-like peptidase domain-containing protein [Armatimonadetes bacterium]|nr:trypsin-like peptidase domain-containing protein [Armatimonadota bacterium]
MRASTTARRSFRALCLLAFATGAYADAVAELQDTVANVADKVRPCVVSIVTRQELARPPVAMPAPPNQRGPQFGEARGSGMLFRETDQYYYILTNAHVVRGAPDGKVKVKLVAERSERDGTVIGTPDRRNDTAVVRIDRVDGEHLPMIAFGNVKDLRVGQFVLAIGSPFDFESSVTLGIVSSLNRELREPEDPREGARQPETYRGLIQADAAINPGNSGGPLVNLKGEVIGITFAIFSPGAAGNVGIGFAIPIDRAQRSLEDLIQKGHVVRGYMGVQILDLSEKARREQVSVDEVRKHFGVDTGVLVASVADGTPAKQAGLQQGDVIVAVNGEAVDTSGDLQDKVSVIAPGTEIALSVYRDGQKMEVHLTLGELPVAPVPDGAAPPEAPKPRANPLGIKVEKLTAEKAKELGLEPAGLLVTAAEEGGVGAANGLVPRTVILAGRRTGQERVVLDSVADFEALIDAASAQGDLVSLWLSVAADGKTRVPVHIFFRVPKAGEGGE